MISVTSSSLSFFCVALLVCFFTVLSQSSFMQFFLLSLIVFVYMFLVLCFIFVFLIKIYIYIYIFEKDKNSVCLYPLIHVNFLDGH